MSHRSASLLKPVVVTAVGCLGESHISLPCAWCKSNKRVIIDFSWVYSVWKKMWWIGLPLSHLLSWIFESRRTFCASVHSYNCCRFLLMVYSTTTANNTQKGHKFPLPLVPPFWLQFLCFLLLLTPIIFHFASAGFLERCHLSQLLYWSRVEIGLWVEHAQLHKLLPQQQIPSAKSWRWLQAQPGQCHSLPPRTSKTKLFLFALLGGAI